MITGILSDPPAARSNKRVKTNPRPAKTTRTLRKAKSRAESTPEPPLVPDSPVMDALRCEETLSDVPWEDICAESTQVEEFNSLLPLTRLQHALPHMSVDCRLISTYRRLYRANLLEQLRDVTGLLDGVKGTQFAFGLDMGSILSERPLFAHLDQSPEQRITMPELAECLIHFNAIKVVLYNVVNRQMDSISAHFPTAFQNCFPNLFSGAEIVLKSELVGAQRCCPVCQEVPIGYFYCCKSLDTHISMCEDCFVGSLSVPASVRDPVRSMFDFNCPMCRETPFSNVKLYYSVDNAPPAPVNDAETTNTVN